MSHFSHALSFSIFVLWIAFPCYLCQPGYISPFIGLDTYNGDSISATSARLFRPNGVFVDSDGNLFIADSSNNRVRKVFPNGTIATVAGTGFPGYNGDGQLATSAQLYNPTDVFVTKNGTLFIAESRGCRVRRVSVNGTISTVVGTGSCGFNGNGLSTIVNVYPKSVWLDESGNMLIAEEGNNRVRLVFPNGTVTTVAGTGTASYNGDLIPAQLAALSSPNDAIFDQMGNILVADRGNHRVRIVYLNGTIATFAGNGRTGFAADGTLAQTATIGYPTSLAWDTAGNLLVAEQSNHRTVQIQSGIVYHYVGQGYGFSGDGGLSALARFRYPSGMSVDSSGNLYIPEFLNHVVRKVSADKSLIVTVAGDAAAITNFGPVPASSAFLVEPQQVIVDCFGNILVADRALYCVRKLSSDGIFSTIAGKCGISGTPISGSLANATLLSYPMGIGIDSECNLLISDNNIHKVHKVFLNGTIITIASVPNPVGIFGHESGSIFVVSQGLQAVVEILPNGTQVLFAGNTTKGFGGDGGPATDAMLSDPFGVWADCWGNAYITETGNGRVRKVFANRTISTFVGTNTKGSGGDNGAASLASLANPRHISGDAQGNILVSDSWVARVRQINPKNIISTVAGNGKNGFAGDGGPATSAFLDSPTSAVFDVQGNILIVDCANVRVRKVSGPDFWWTQPPTTFTLQNPFASIKLSGSFSFQSSYFCSLTTFGPDGQTTSTLRLTSSSSIRTKNSLMCSNWSVEQGEVLKAGPIKMLLKVWEKQSGSELPYVGSKCSFVLVTFAGFGSARAMN